MTKGNKEETTFEIIEHGLCEECQQEISAIAYGGPTITPRRYPDDWRKRIKAQDKKYEELTDQRRTRVVVVITTLGEDGLEEHTICERHLRLALDALVSP